MLMVMVVAVGRGDAAVEGSKWGTEERKIITTAAVDTRFNETLPTHPLFFHTHTHMHIYIRTYRVYPAILPLPLSLLLPRLSALEVIRICRIRFLIALARRGICPGRPGNPALMNARDNGLNPFGGLAIIPRTIYTSLPLTHAHLRLQLPLYHYHYNCKTVYNKRLYDKHTHTHTHTYINTHIHIYII